MSFPPGTTQASTPHTNAQAANPPQPHTPPIHQVTPALLSVAQGADGSQRLTVRLNPAELGLVQISIDRSAAGTAHVVITAERPETLQTLQEDQAEMHRTLDHAGIPTEGRTLAFHVAASSQPQPGGNGTSSGGSSNSNSHGADTGTSYSPGNNRQTARDQGGGGTSRRHTLADTPSDAQPTPQRWQRVGLDITA